MDQDVTPPTLMRPRRRVVPIQRRATPYPRRVLTPSHRPTNVYVDEEGDEEHEEAHYQNSGSMIGMVVAVITVILIFLFVVVWMWRCNSNRNKGDNSVNLQTIPISNTTGKPLIAENGSCSTNSDCRRGLECFQGRCSTSRRITELRRLDSMHANTKAPSAQESPKQEAVPELTQEEKDRILREREEAAKRAMQAQQKPVEQPKKKHVVIGGKHSPNRFEYAKEAGLRSILRPANAVSDADQDFGY